MSRIIYLHISYPSRLSGQALGVLWAPKFTITTTRVFFDPRDDCSTSSISMACMWQTFSRSLAVSLFPFLSPLKKKKKSPRKKKKSYSFMRGINEVICSTRRP